MPFIDNFICFCGDGMIESMLEPHMKSAAGSSQYDVGIAFLILGGLYMSCSLIAGVVRIFFSNNCAKVLVGERGWGLPAG